MIKIKNKISIILFIVIFTIMINTISSAKYVMESEFLIANLNIDRTKPDIEVESIENTNIEFKNYANNTHVINIKLKIIEKNIKEVFVDNNHIKVKVENTYINSDNVKISKISNEIYEIQIKSIEGNGVLKLDVLEGTVVDNGLLENAYKQIDTKIIIDNVAPKGTFLETKISDGRVKGIVRVSENIRNLDGWKFIENNLKLEKEFTNNISYQLPIKDYAGNSSTIEIKITQATYIKVTYASHNSEIGWTFGYGNYDIAGDEAIKKDSKFKTEALAFNVAGNIEDDFLQAKGYVYTHWGEGSVAKCNSSGILYNYGYNPNNGTYKSMKSNDLVTMNNSKYFQFGGGGINAYMKTDINGKNPIPFNTAYEYRYGICGISIKLKDYSQFSVIYQILVDKVGWISSCSDGEECMNGKTKPISAFRMALVPKSEKQYVMDNWNKDIGTYNLK